MEHSPERQRQFSTSAESASRVVPLSDAAVQQKLIMSAFPEAETPILPWLEEDGEGHSLAERYRIYVEAPEHTGETVDLSDEERIRLLLEEVKGQTLH
jgi:hypothetical protein